MATKRYYFHVLTGLLALLGFGAAFCCSTPDEYGAKPEDYRLLYGPAPTSYRDSVPETDDAAVKELVTPQDESEDSDE